MTLLTICFVFSYLYTPYYNCHIEYFANTFSAHVIQLRCILVCVVYPVQHTPHLNQIYFVISNLRYNFTLKIVLYEVPESIFNYLKEICSNTCIVHNMFE